MIYGGHMRARFYCKLLHIAAALCQDHGLALRYAGKSTIFRLKPL